MLNYLSLAYGNTNIASSRWLMSTDLFAHTKISHLGFTMPYQSIYKSGESTN